MIEDKELIKNATEVYFKLKENRFLNSEDIFADLANTLRRNNNDRK